MVSEYVESIYHFRVPRLSDAVKAAKNRVRLARKSLKLLNSITFLVSGDALTDIIEVLKTFLRDTARDIAVNGIAIRDSNTSSYIEAVGGASVAILKDGRYGISICSLADTFNKKVGAKLAIERARTLKMSVDDPTMIYSVPWDLCRVAGYGAKALRDVGREEQTHWAFKAALVSIVERTREPNIPYIGQFKYV